MNKVLRNLALGIATVALAAAPVFASTGASKPLNERVRHELLMLPYFTIFDDLGYKVDGNTVYLTGDVVRPWLKDDAARAVKHIEGVENVVNQINVLPLSPLDNRIRMAEYRAIFGFGGLYRYAMGANPSIHIIVDNGHVKLMGVVGTQMDKNMAGIRANGVPGVFSVDNDLVVARS